MKKRNQLVSFYIKKGNLVDVGCMFGSLRPYLNNNIKYNGIDIRQHNSSKMNFSYIQADIQQYQGKINHADYVTMIAVIEHLKYPEKALQNVWKILKNNGKLIITTPTKFGGKIHRWASFVRLTSKDAAEEHEIFFSLEELSKLLEKQGFVVTEKKKFFFGLNQIIVAKKI